MLKLPALKKPGTARSAVTDAASCPELNKSPVSGPGVEEPDVAGAGANNPRLPAPEFRPPNPVWLSPMRPILRLLVPVLPNPMLPRPMLPRHAAAAGVLPNLMCCRSPAAPQARVAEPDIAVAEVAEPDVAVPEVAQPQVLPAEVATAEAGCRGCPRSG